VESTGGYENNWYRFLKLQSFGARVLVSRLNPSGVKAISEATLKRTITDSVSAHNIAHYLVLFGEKVDYQSHYVSNSQFQESRQYYNFITMLVRQKVQLGNQLEKLLYQYYSEVLVFTGDQGDQPGESRSAGSQISRLGTACKPSDATPDPIHL
jgi:transposase